MGFGRLRVLLGRRYALEGLPQMQPETLVLMPRKKGEETKLLKNHPSEVLAEESYYDDYCVKVWFFLLTTKLDEIVVSEIVKPENRERWIEKVKRWIDCQKKPEVLFTSDYSILKFYR